MKVVFCSNPANLVQVIFEYRRLSLGEDDVTTKVTLISSTGRKIGCVDCLRMPRMQATSEKEVFGMCERMLRDWRVGLVVPHGKEFVYECAGRTDSTNAPFMDDDKHTTTVFFREFIS